MEPKKPPKYTPPGARFRWLMENAMEQGLLRQHRDLRKITENQRLRVYNRVMQRSTGELIDLETERGMHFGKPIEVAQSEALSRVSRWVVDGKIKQA